MQLAGLGRISLRLCRVQDTLSRREQQRAGKPVPFMLLGLKDLVDVYSLLGFRKQLAAISVFNGADEKGSALPALGWFLPAKGCSYPHNYIMSRHGPEGNKRKLICDYVSYGQNLSYYAI